MASHRAGTRRAYRAGAFRRGGSPPGTSIHRAENYRIAEQIGEALDASTAPGKVRTLADMTQEEQAEMTKLYMRKAKP